MYMECGALGENGYCESLNPKLPKESLQGEIFSSSKELPALADGWRVNNNTFKPDSLLGNNPPAQAAWPTWATQGNGRTARFPISLPPTTATS
jgi:hypothetical protein